MHFPVSPVLHLARSSRFGYFLASGFLLPFSQSSSSLAGRSTRGFGCANPNVLLMPASVAGCVPPTPWDFEML